LEIKNIKVYDLEESLTASGYPMSIEMDETKASIERGKKLGSVKSGSGHDNFLKGIRVSFDLVAPHYFLIQFMRYSYFDIVSSQSKMHKILNMDITKQCNNFVLPEIIEIVEKLIKQYNSENDKTNKKLLFQQIIANTPMGFELGMRISTNYLQLKTALQQRKNHKLLEWHYFCENMIKLPKFADLTNIRL